MGDYVVIVNARHVALSGTKSKTKLYQWHTGYPGGLKTLTARQVLERRPERVLEEAVMRMLPKSLLRREWAKRLRIFPDEAHEHASNTNYAAKNMPEYVARYQPVVPGLKPKPATGDLVADYISDVEEEVVAAAAPAAKAPKQ